MSTSAVYQEKARSLTSTPQLLQLWTSIEQGATPGWPPGKAFEYLIIRAFELEHADVRYPYEVPGETGIIEQIDGAIHAHGLSFLIESKDFRRQKTNIEPIAKLQLRLDRRPSSVIGVIFSRTGLTDAALEIGLPPNILLWQGKEIAVALRNQKMLEGLKIKLRHAAEDGVRDYNLLDEGWP